METSMLTSVCDAISNRDVVEFGYDGGIRVVEPHCHGLSTAGHESLRAYQIGGYSKSGRPEGWRLYDVAKIVGLRRTGARFAENRQGYNPNDVQMKSVHCHV
jgi:hypothetical protein